MNTTRSLRIASAVALALAASCSDETPTPAPVAAPAALASTTHVTSAAHHVTDVGNEPVMNQFHIDRGVIQYRAPTRPRVAPKRTVRATPPAVPPPSTTSTLVLYDDGGPWGWLGELYAVGMGTLASHFGTWSAEPIEQYVAGDMNSYTAVIYVGSTFDQPIPAAFLTDVQSQGRPVLWIDDNIWELVNADATFASTYDFMPYIFDTSAVATVTYKGVALARYSANGAGVMTYTSVGTTATTLAVAARADGTTIPWAIQSGNLTYIGENPLAYIGPQDRYLALCDILFDVLAPTTPARHRALVRIEDVNSTNDPGQLRSVANYLATQKAPFSVATIPLYLDPNGYYNGGVPVSTPLTSAPSVVKALQYMLTKGGQLVMHGYTHQYSNIADPYDAVTADDFEFYVTNWDAAGSLQYDGPIANDSSALATGRIQTGLALFTAAGLPQPTIWEFPHYAGSPVDAQAIHAILPVAYHRGIYFTGALTGAPTNFSQYIGLFYPYEVVDVYGFKIIPENLGYYEPTPDHNNPVWLASDIITTAQMNLVVRDGFASFFYHPYYGVEILESIVAGVEAAGYTFVSPDSL